MTISFVFQMTTNFSEAFYFVFHISPSFSEAWTCLLISSHFKIYLYIIQVLIIIIPLWFIYFEIFLDAKNSTLPCSMNVVSTHSY